MSVEQWRVIPGWEGYYSVSDRGRVRSEGRWTGREGAKGRRRLHQCILKPGTRRHGYRSVFLCREGGRRNVVIHQLVLLAFVGPRPGGCVACHGDGDPNNNRLSNLRWDTYKNNSHDTLLHGRSNRGERCGGSKLVEAEVFEILRRARGGENQRLLGVEFGVSTTAINHIHRGTTWGWLTNA